MAFAILRKTSTRFSAAIIFIWFFSGCVGVPVGRPSEHIAVGMNSFALAARYGTPASYQHQGEYLQLNYGSAAAGCKVIVLIEEAQYLVGWASSGGMCSNWAR